MAHHPLKGSERQPLHGAKAAGKADPTERLEVSLLLRRNQPDAFKDRVQKIATRDHKGPHLSREEFEKQFGAADADIAAVRAFARQHNLAVVQEHAGRRTVVLSGTVGQFNSAFNVDLQRFDTPADPIGGASGPSSFRTSSPTRFRPSLASTTAPSPSRIFAPISPPASIGTPMPRLGRHIHRCRSPRPMVFRPGPARASVLRSSNSAAVSGRPTSQRISPASASARRRRSPPYRWTTARTSRPVPPTDPTAR